MVTSSDSPPHVEEAQRLGARTFVTKPVRFENLVEAIARAGLMSDLFQVEKGEAEGLPSA